ncbi:hypothetical protein F8M41_009586 [Gigaspora margarita]|uniref:Uncharacterized protein n=1 Tax=Gigaspora margarita TaxID=4874 RepID=A0A8H4AUW3_GIGMA|nr:hypothetical protein F8M41_009586 [Gigaspora margarita]
MLSIVKANPSFEDCSIEGLNTSTIDINFSPDPITSPGPSVTTFNISGDIGAGSLFSLNAVLFIEYLSSIDGTNPGLSIPVPSGQQTFSMQLYISTPINTLPDHIIRFNLWDTDKHVGCVRFRRNVFND